MTIEKLVHGVLSGGPAREAECRDLLNSTVQPLHRPLDHHHRAAGAAAEPTKIKPFTENTLLCAMHAAGVSYPWFARAERGKGSESACRLAIAPQALPGAARAPGHQPATRGSPSTLGSGRTAAGGLPRPSPRRASLPSASLHMSADSQAGARRELVLARLRALQSPPPERCFNLTRLAAYWNGGLAASFHVCQLVSIPDPALSPDQLLPCSIPIPYREADHSQS